MGRYVFSGVGAVQAGWVRTRLNNGDELATLAPLYSLTAQQVVEGNDVAFNSAAIEGDGGWVQRAGSQSRGAAVPWAPAGRWLFDTNTVILLPPGGPRTVVGGSTTGGGVQAAGSGVSPIAIGAFALAAALLLLRKKKKKGESGGAKVTRWST